MIDDLYDFMSVGNTNATNSKATESTVASGGGDDILAGILDLSPQSNGGSSAPQEVSSEKKKKHKKKRKNGVIRDETSPSTETLFEDDSIRISFTATPWSKKAEQYLDVRFVTENRSESTLKSVKISLSKASWLRAKDKDKSSWSLGKKLESGSSDSTSIKMKCSRFNGDDSDCIKCKISYNDFKSKTLTLHFKTHCFVIGDDDGAPSEEEVLEMMENEEKFGCSATERLKELMENEEKFGCSAT